MRCVRMIIMINNNIHYSKFNMRDMTHIIERLLYIHKRRTPSIYITNRESRTPSHTERVFCMHYIHRENTFYWLGGEDGGQSWTATYQRQKKRDVIYIGHAFSTCTVYIHRENTFFWLGGWRAELSGSVSASKKSHIMCMSHIIYT